MLGAQSRAHQQAMLAGDNLTPSSWTPEDVTLVMAWVLAQVAQELRGQLRPSAATAQLPAACSPTRALSSDFQEDSSALDKQGHSRRHRGSVKAHAQTGDAGPSATAESTAMLVPADITSAPALHVGVPNTEFPVRPDADPGFSTLRLPPPCHPPPGCDQFAALPVPAQQVPNGPSLGSAQFASQQLGAAAVPGSDEPTRVFVAGPPPPPPPPPGFGPIPCTRQAPQATALPAVKPKLLVKFKRQLARSILKLLLALGEVKVDYHEVMAAIDAFFAGSPRPAGKATPFFKHNKGPVLLWRVEGTCEDGNQPSHLVRKVMLLGEKSLVYGWTDASILEIAFAFCFKMGWLSDAPAAGKECCLAVSTMSRAAGCYAQCTHNVDKAEAASTRSLEGMLEDFSADQGPGSGGLIVIIDYPMMKGDLMQFADYIHQGERDQHGVRVFDLWRVAYPLFQVTRAIYAQMAYFRVIHNDIKLENLLMDKYGGVYLHDFEGATFARMVNGELQAWQARVGTVGYTCRDRLQQLDSKAHHSVRFFTKESYDIASMALTEAQLLFGCHLEDLCQLEMCYPFWVGQLTGDDLRTMRAIIHRPENAHLKQLCEQTDQLSSQLQASVDQIRNCGDKQGPGSATDLYHRTLHEIARGVFAVHLRPNMEQLVDAMYIISEEASKLQGEDRMVQVSGLLGEFNLMEPVMPHWQAAIAAQEAMQAAMAAAQQAVDVEMQQPQDAVCVMQYMGQAATGNLSTTAAHKLLAPLAPHAAAGRSLSLPSPAAATAAAAARRSLSMPLPAAAAAASIAVMPVKHQASDRSVSLPAVMCDLVEAARIMPFKHKALGHTSSLQAESDSGFIGVGYEHTCTASQCGDVVGFYAPPQRVANLSNACGADKTVHEPSTACNSETRMSLGSGVMDMDVPASSVLAPFQLANGNVACMCATSRAGVDVASLADQDNDSNCAAADKAADMAPAAADTDADITSSEADQAVDSTTAAADKAVDRYHEAADTESDIITAAADQAVGSTTAAGDRAVDRYHVAADKAVSTALAEPCSVHSIACSADALQQHRSKHATKLAMAVDFLLSTTGSTQRVAAAAYAALAGLDNRSLSVAELAAHARGHADETVVRARAATALHSMSDVELPMQASSLAVKVTGSDSHASKLATAADVLLNTTGPTQRVAAAAYAALVRLDCHAMSVAELAAHARSPAVEQSGFHSQSCPSEEGSQWYLSQDGRQSSVLHGYRLESSSSGRSTDLCSLDAAESVGTLDVMDADVSAGYKDDAAAELLPLIPAPNNLHSAPVKMRSGLTLPSISTAAPGLYKRAVFWLKKKAKATTHTILGCFNA